MPRALNACESTHHCGTDGYEGHLPEIWRVDDAHSPLVLCEDVAEVGVHGNGVHCVELAAHVADGLESPAHWEVESVIVLDVTILEILGLEIRV